MPRPHKQRTVSESPDIVIYKPAGVPARSLEWVTLSLDEFESIRQIDHEGESQESVAAKMGVSRPTVTRIYQSARKKIARVLVGGLAMKIEGGPVRISAGASSSGQCGRGCGPKHSRQRRGGRGCGAQQKE
jgi:predicted DNA-binding protein (UPF0251 family)